MLSTNEGKVGKSLKMLRPSVASAESKLAVSKVVGLAFKLSVAVESTTEVTCGIGIGSAKSVRASARRMRGWAACILAVGVRSRVEVIESN